jgi:hypothetical protein
MMTTMPWHGSALANDRQKASIHPYHPALVTLKLICLQRMTSSLLLALMILILKNDSILLQQRALS